MTAPNAAAMVGPNSHLRLQTSSQPPTQQLHCRDVETVPNCSNGDMSTPLWQAVTMSTCQWFYATMQHHAASWHVQQTKTNPFINILLNTTAQLN